MKQKIKELEDKIRELTIENTNLKNRIETENKIEKIYQNMPSLQNVEETLYSIASNIKENLND